MEKSDLRRGLVMVRSGNPTKAKQLEALAHGGVFVDPPEHDNSYVVEAKAKDFIWRDYCLQSVEQDMNNVLVVATRTCLAVSATDLAQVLKKIADKNAAIYIVEEDLTVKFHPDAAAVAVFIDETTRAIEGRRTQAARAARSSKSREGRPKTPIPNRAEAKRMWMDKENYSAADVAKATGVSKSKLWRHLGKRYSNS
jgi:DNA invertase Pin-like site-specific DNA recombinase